MRAKDLNRWRREALEKSVIGEIDIPFPKDASSDPRISSQVWADFLDRVMSRLITKRRQDESKIIGNGKTSVWFSHDVDKGGLKHWLLILHDQKYELRRERRDGYYYKKTPFIIDMEQRERAITQLGRPQKDRYYIGLLGSTSMTPADVEEKFKARIQEFGDYDLFSNNCQHFILQVAKQVVEEKAPDWEWFADNLVSPKNHEYVERLNGVPIDVMGAWLETLKEQRNNLPAEDREKVDRNIRVLEQYTKSFNLRVATGNRLMGGTDVRFFPRDVNMVPPVGAVDVDNGNVEADYQGSGEGEGGGGEGEDWGGDYEVAGDLGGEGGGEGGGGGGGGGDGGGGDAGGGF
ncbi:hypothetical protein CPLU01_11451 [Colletotrichum plurivorum]|uniref:PPPDE domain-containing protein n=1 Tax=Colletotrichum plurivorum TaxID=2175906 RepID=A0A8H6N8J1_9PEZI|nr:hypothetical protein CPLU01_11451 [Colletotrichum plurivorum]